MNYFYTILFCSLALFFSCKQVDHKKSLLTEGKINELAKKTDEGSNISSRFPVPVGFERTIEKKNSFAHYLREFPLLPDGEKVHLFDGSLKYYQDGHAGVLDIDVGKSDLQQCADAVMRLRSEYLFENKRYGDIAFNFTNGWKFEYQKWREGKNLVVKGNRTNWIDGSDTKESYKDFRAYLDQVFMYAGTLSLSKELKTKSLDEIEIGDVIIWGGSPGHAVIIVDMCKNPENGDKAILLAQSYMPAQQIHILKNLQNPENSPWYLISQIENKIVTPDWTFESDQLMSF
ncbi:MAG: hypothetical protein ACJA1A_000388 [Saprospiraceae bacterium]|jgi:hypothetical protein